MLLGAGLPGVAAAQATGGADAASPAEGGDVGVLQEVVVTAQRRSQNILDVPASVTVTTASDLQGAGVDTLASLPQLVPGLRIDFAGAVAQPTIRGVAGAISGPGASSTVAVYIDGYVRPDGNGLDAALSDAADIQTLKGPQGTLFGRNTTGGALLISTRGPAFEYQGEARLSYGNYGEVSGSLFMAAPLTETLAASVSVFGHRSDGFRHNITTDDREGDYSKEGVRAKLLYRPSDKAEIDLALEHTRVDDANGLLFSPYKGQTSGVLVPGTVIPSGRGTVAADAPSQHGLKMDGAYLTQKYDLGPVRLTSYSGVQNIIENPNTLFDLDATSAPIFTTAFPGKDRIYTQELQLNSNDQGRLVWVAGLYYMNQAASITTSGSLGIPGGKPFATFFNARQDLSAYAAYADVTYQVADRLFVTLGGRYWEDHLTGERKFPPDFAATPKLKKTFSDFDYRAVLRYEFNDNTSAYASFNKGSKGGTFNVTGSDDAPVRPENIEAYELGFKTRQGPLYLDASAFRYDYKNLQVSSYDNTSQILNNAASARIQGLDAQVRWAVNENFDLSGGVTVLDTKYKSFPTAVQYLFSPTTGIVATSADAAGNQLIRAPKFSSSINATYHRELARGELELTASYAYQSKVYFDSFETISQGAYGTLNGRVAWTAPDGRWTIAAYGRNLTDESYRNQVLLTTIGFLETYGWPRTYGVELSIKY